MSNVKPIYIFWCIIVSLFRQKIFKYTQILINRLFLKLDLEMSYIKQMLFFDLIENILKKSLKSRQIPKSQPEKMQSGVENRETWGTLD